MIRKREHIASIRFTTFPSDRSKAEAEKADEKKDDKKDGDKENENKDFVVIIWVTEKMEYQNLVEQANHSQNTPGKTSTKHINIL